MTVQLQPGYTMAGNEDLVRFQTGAGALIVMMDSALEQ